MSVAGGSAIAPTSGGSIVEVVDGSIMDVVVMEECVDVPFNDEEASSEVLEPVEEQEEQEDNKRR